MIRNRAWVYVLAYLGFFLKSQGAYWDVAYHFKHLRELTQLPHILNGIGNAILIIIFLILVHAARKTHRSALLMMLAGIVTFGMAIPIDDLWHRLFGIDLQIWSPPHLLLYSGTFISAIAWMLFVRRDFVLGTITRPTYAFLLTVFSVSLFDCLWFLLMQHEHGAIAGPLLANGTYQADGDIMRLFAQGHGRIYGMEPGFGYPMWAAFSLALFGQTLHKLRLHRFAFTAAIGIYLLNRGISSQFLASLSYSLPTQPLFLLLCTLLFDLAKRKHASASGLRDLVFALILVAPLFVWNALPFPTPFVPAFTAAAFFPSVGSAWIGLRIASLGFAKCEAQGRDSKASSRKR